VGYRLPSLLRMLAFGIVSVLGMLIAVELLGETHVSVDAFDLALSLSPLQQGITEIHLPPMGEISAHTHWFPFQVNITFLNVDIDLLAQNVENEQNIELWQQKLINDALWGVGWFAVRNMIVAFLGAGIAAYFLGPPEIKSRFWKGGTLGALLLIILILVTMVIPFNLAAFENPQYYGILSAAPWAMNLFDEGLMAIQTVSEKLQNMAGNLFYLFEGLEQLSAIETDTETSLKVMHVSDVHNNPAAVDFMREVVKAFDVDMVIDTGDITDYGYPLEAEIVSGVAEIGVPYVLAPGNHDSPMVYEHLEERGVIVLNNEIREIDGMVIAGIKDPAAASHATVSTPEEEMKEYAESEVKDMFEEQEIEPDVVAVHDPLLGEIFSDQAPLVLTGHTHIPDIREKDDTVIINAGTTGAAGIRGLDRPEEKYSMYILNFNQVEETEELYLSAADFISVPQLPGGFNLERHYFQRRESYTGGEN